MSDPAVAGESLPRQLGKYTLLRKLAVGGMAELFLALHRSVAGFEKLVVIKRILPLMHQDDGFIEMLLHEARIAATLSHPNIVQIFDVGRVDGKYFIAMEHIHGEDIRSILRAMKKKQCTAFPLEHALSIVIGMCAGLAYAHDRRDLHGARLNIVHRDISPQNVVVTFTGDVKVVDFGIAKSAAQIGEGTKDGQLKGKVPYMSPEQAAGKEIDWRSDIFSAGIMLFELTTGKRLFKGASEYETLRMICEKEYPRPSLVRPGYPLALERIVMKALAKPRDERYASAREMQQDLEAFVREERIAVSQVSLSQWMQTLFESKLAQQKEALQDVKQLADIIAAQHVTGGAFVEGTLPGGTSTPGSVSSVPAPPRRGALGYGAAGVLIASVLAGLLYMRGGQPSSPVPPAPASFGAEAPKARGVLEITSRPEGCAIWINGDLRRETTPAKIERLPLGSEIHVKISHEGMEAYRESVVLTEADPLRRIAAEMKTGSVTVVVKIKPSPTLFVDGMRWKGDGTIAGLSAGEEHKIVASADGFATKTYLVTASPGETKTITDKLIEAEPSGADKPPGEGRPSPAVGGRAKVRVNAKGGFCTVSVNGSSYGPTPIEADVPSGAVRVTCARENGPTLSQSVRVGPGETARVSFKIE